MQSVARWFSKLFSISP